MRRIASATGRTVLYAIALLAVPVTPGVARAQEPDTTDRPCRGEVIVGINIRTVQSTDLERAERYGSLGRIVGFMYRNTHREVIRRYLLVREGGRCAELARGESERVLRAQPFLANANIRVINVAPDSIQLDVATEDELPLNLSGRIERGTLGRIGIGNSNLEGRAVSVELLFEQGFGYRDGYGARFTNYQTLGRPWILDLEAIREPLGGSWVATLRAPFFSDLRVRTWYVGAVSRHAFYPLHRRDGPDVSIELKRDQWLAALAWRVGRPRHAWLIGPLVQGERAQGDGMPVFVTDTGIVAYDGGDFETRNYGYRSMRAGAVVAARSFEHVPVRGFEALNGPQDLIHGAEAVFFTARSFTTRFDIERDVLIGGSFYAGRARPHSLLALEAQGEASRPTSLGKWQGTLMSVRAGWYNQRSTTELTTISAEFAGNRRPRLPSQVTLSDYRSGMRGFGDANVGGAHRLILRADERHLLPPLWRRADFGAAVFAEAGRLWGGHVPFGVTTPWQASIGVSLLGATPRGSKRLWRLDFAVPLTSAGQPSRVDVRASVGDRTGNFWTEPVEIQQVRDGGLIRRVLDAK